MNARSRRSKRRDGALSSLNAAIDATNLAKEALSMTPAKGVFGSVSIVLSMIRDSAINKVDYVDLGLACADVCRALDRGMGGRQPDQLSRSVLEAMEELTATVGEIQRNITKRSKRNAISRLFHARNDKEVIATWRLDLNRILHIFNTELAINTHVTVADVRDGVTNVHTVVSEVQRDTAKAYTMVSELHRNMLTSQEEGTKFTTEHVLTVAQTQTNVPGESPPPAPRVCFGRGELIEEIVALAGNLIPIALIGAGGIGKTSIALTVLHDNRVKKRFGEDRRFIRCDQFPASLPHFLSRLSTVIGAGIENPEDLVPLRPFLSSKEMFIILDNAETILDPRGTDAHDIYAVVQELSQFKTVCVCITSRITTVPPHCKRPEIPTLSVEAACDIFHGIYDGHGRSDVISDLLQRLDFHALSITLLATIAFHNVWDYDRLAREWDARRTQVLRTDYNESLAATIELSLSSPTFRELGPDARDLLGVVAFFPQGIDENNLDWLFPTISDRTKVFDKFRTLSLTHRSDGFITMLAPLRDYLGPKDPNSSPLLCTTKECYFSRLSVDVDPRSPSFKATRWITSEDVNVEHLLDVFTSIDANSSSVWDTCNHFMKHLYWHKQRLVILRPKIEGLPDDHPAKPRCWLLLSRLFRSVGNYVEYKNLLIHTLKLRRERGNDFQVAQALRFLADANLRLRLYKEGISQAREALEIYQRHNEVSGQADCWKSLARLLYEDKQFEAAEEAACRAIDLLSDESDPVTVCHCHRVLGDICRSRDNAEKAINHFEKALEIASSFAWQAQQFWILCSLAELLFAGGRVDDAYAHIERSKLHAIDSIYLLGRAMRLQAYFWYKQRRFEEAKSEALGAADVFEKLAATKDAEDCKKLLQDIEEEMNLVTSSGWDVNAPQGTDRE